MSDDAGQLSHCGKLFGPDQRSLGLFAFGDVDAAADVAGKRRAGAYHRNTIAHDPAIFTVESAQTIFERKGHSLVERRDENLTASIEVFRVNARDPLVAAIMIHICAGEFE